VRWAAFLYRAIRDIGPRAFRLNKKASPSSTQVVPRYQKSDTLVTEETSRPILFVDVDGVISLFGFSPGAGQLPGPLHWIDGVAHCIPDDVGARLVTLADRFELVWATGWEERANEHLPFILELPFRELPTLVFDGRAVFGSAHWKVDAINEYAGERPAAWIDDNHTDAGRRWADERAAPTLLVSVDPAIGWTRADVDRVVAWAGALTGPGDG
jgi:hypothetical protein